MNIDGGADASWLQWILGGLAAAGATIGGWGWAVLAGRIEKQAEDIRDDIAEQGRKLEKEVADNIGERRRMWERLDSIAAQIARNRLEDYTVFVSKDDLGRLERSIADMLERHESHVRDLINNRPPVRQE